MTPIALLIASVTVGGVLFALASAALGPRCCGRQMRPSETPYHMECPECGNTRYVGP